MYIKLDKIVSKSSKVSTQWKYFVERCAMEEDIMGIIKIIIFFPIMYIHALYDGFLRILYASYLTIANKVKGNMKKLALLDLLLREIQQPLEKYMQCKLNFILLTKDIIELVAEDENNELLKMSNEGMFIGSTYKDDIINVFIIVDQIPDNKSIFVISESFLHNLFDHLKSVKPPSILFEISHETFTRNNRELIIQTMDKYKQTVKGIDNKIVIVDTNGVKLI